MTTTRSLLALSRKAAVVGALGAAVAFAGAGVAAAQTTNPLGSLGSVSGLANTDTTTNLGTMSSDMFGASGSMTQLLGSTQTMLNAGSIDNALNSMIAGSSTGSAGSLGQFAGNINQAGVPAAVTGSANGSSQATAVFNNGAISAGSITSMLDSASASLPK